MMSTLDLAPVVKTLEVARSAADAFRIFTGEIGAWWPRTTHTRAKTTEGEISVSVTIEPHVGGRVYETLADGRTLDWGEVKAFEPGRLYVMTWRMRDDAALWSRVSVRFESVTQDRCTVTLTHDCWENYGEDAALVRDRYQSGWETVFSRDFASAVA